MNTDKQYKYINFKLYKEFFRQLSIISLIFLGIIMLFTVLIPVNSMFSVISMAKEGKTVVDTIDSFLHYMIIFTAYVPVLVLYAFNFLTKRNASDYYHSFPHTRPCLYLTLTASIISWILIVLFSNTFVSILIYTILGKYFILNIGRLLLFSLSMLICSLLVTASIALACTVTGTTFTNVAVSGLIIFLPRILITAFCEIITSSHGVLVTGKLFPLFYSDKNIVFNTVNIIFGTEGELSLFKTTPLIYTFILAVIYFAAAGFLFTKRKSETAGTPASGKKTQNIIRIAISLPITLFAIIIIFGRLTGSASIGASEVFNIFVIYIIAIMVMFIYEFISSRKIRNIVKALPAAGMLIITNIIIIAGLYIIDTTQLNYTPSGEEIEYVTLAENYIMHSDPTYLDRILEDYRITDPSLVNFVSDKLAETVKHCKNDDAYSYFYKDGYKTMTVGIKSGLFVKYRNLCMPREEYEQFYADLYSTDEIKQRFINLPEYDKYSSLIEISDTIDEKTSEELYNTLRDELKSVDPAEWATLVRNSVFPIYLTYQTIIDDDSTYTCMPLCMLTPKTLLSYINIINSSVTEKGFGKIAADIIEKGNENPEEINYNVDINVLSDNYTSYKMFCTLFVDADDEDDEPLEIYAMDEEPGQTSMPEIYDSVEMDEDYMLQRSDSDLIATIYDTSEIKEFVKNSFNNPAPIDSLGKEGYELVSIHLTAYNYSSVAFTEDSIGYMSPEFIEKTIYVLVESDKIAQFITEHAVK